MGEKRKEGLLGLKKIYLTDELTGKIHTVRMKYGFIYIFKNSYLILIPRANTGSK